MPTHIPQILIHFLPLYLPALLVCSHSSQTMFLKPNQITSLLTQNSRTGFPISSMQRPCNGPQVLRECVPAPNTLPSCHSVPAPSCSLSSAVCCPLSTQGALPQHLCTQCFFSPEHLIPLPTQPQLQNFVPCLLALHKCPLLNSTLLDGPI